MLDPIKFNKSAMRGREPANLVENEEGNFAFNENLRSKLSLTSIYVAVGKTASEIDICAAGLLSVLSNRRIEFIFCDETSTDWCKADFVFLRDIDTGVFSSDDVDAFIGVIAIASNTQWCQKLFPVADGLDMFLHEVWSGVYDGVVTKLRYSHITGKNPNTTAVDSLNYVKQRIMDYMKLVMVKSIIFNKLATSMEDHPEGVVVVPRNGLQVGELEVQKRVLMLEGSKREADPVIAITGVLDGEWVVIPAITETVEFKAVACVTISTTLEAEFGPEFSVQIKRAWGYQYEKDRSGDERVKCKNRGLAFAFAAWLRDKFKGKEGIILDAYANECS